MHPFAGKGVAEGEAFGVEVKTVGGAPVEDVPLDGYAESFWMGTVDTELVRSAAFWEKFNALGRGELIIGEGGFAKTMVNHLTRTVEWIF